MNSEYKIVSEKKNNSIKSVTEVDQNDDLENDKIIENKDLNEDDINKLFFQQKWRMIRSIGGSSVIPQSLKTYD